MLTRLSYAVYRRSSSLRYRFERRFTRAGVLVLAAALVSAGLGMDLEQSLAYQLFSFLCALLAISVMSAVFFRGAFGVSRSLPRFASVGKRLSYTMRVENRTSIRQAGLALLENVTDARMSYAEFAAISRAPYSRSFRRARFPSGRRALVQPRLIPPVAPRGIPYVWVWTHVGSRCPTKFAGGTAPTVWAPWRGRMRNSAAGSSTSWPLWSRSSNRRARSSRLAAPRAWSPSSRCSAALAPGVC